MREYPANAPFVALVLVFYKLKKQFEAVVLLTESRSLNHRDFKETLEMLGSEVNFSFVSKKDDFLK